MAVNANWSPVESKNNMTARYLFENGADMNLPAGHGNAETALQRARKKGNMDLLVLFEE